MNQKMFYNKFLFIIYLLKILFLTQINVADAQLIDPIVLVHGGAGDIPVERYEGKLRGVKLAARIGYKELTKYGSVIRAVEAAVRSMENDDYFNAGYGSVLTSEGKVEMDASIMDGKTLKAGCVTGIEDILNPITLAKHVMEKTQHNFLGGKGAMDFAKKQGIQILPAGSLVTEYAKDALEEWKILHAKNPSYLGTNELIGERNPKCIKPCGDVGTVGAVAIDQFGNIAAATSTGGMTGKLPGRIGDSPIIGSGCFADNDSGAVSTTGFGEYIMVVNLAQDIIKRIQYLNETPQQATERALESMEDKTGGTAGAIVINKYGNVGISFSSKIMSWAYQKGDKIFYGIEKDDFREENAVQEEEKVVEKYDDRFDKIVED